MAAPRKIHVLITGCTPGGIGHSLALEFHRRGCHVIGTARDVSVLDGLVAMGMSAVPLEVTDEASIAAMKEKVAAITGGKLDILVNNAGRTHVLPALDACLADIRQTFEINTFGPMLVTNALIPQLIAARGLIVNISSVSSLVPYLFGATYSATKGALNVWSRALRMEVRPFGVRVMVAMTGTVKSNIAGIKNHLGLPQGSLYQPVNDVFQKRLTFSQTNATVPTEDYARQLVPATLKGEGWLGGRIGGTPNYFYAGGFARLLYITTWMPSWLSERITANFFGMPAVTKRLQKAWASKLQ